MDSGKLSAIIDFSGAAVGDPACDLVIAWTYLSGKTHKIFMSEWLIGIHGFAPALGRYGPTITIKLCKKSILYHGIFLQDLHIVPM